MDKKIVDGKPETFYLSGVPPSSPTTLLSPAKAAREFGVTAATVSRWATEGRLPFIKTLGGHFRFKREDIERLLSGEHAS